MYRKAIMLKHLHVSVILFNLYMISIQGVPLQRKQFSEKEVRNAKIDYVLKVNADTASKFSNKHKYLKPIIDILHQAVVLHDHGLQQVGALRILNSRRRLINKSSLTLDHIIYLNQHQPTFFPQIIMDSRDLIARYGTHKATLKHKLYADVEMAINKICDPLSQELLQQKFNLARQKANRRIHKKNAVYPNKISEQEAIEQKIALMQFTNYTLSSLENENCPDIQNAISFATIYNIAITLLQKEFRDYNTDQLLGLMANHSENLINLETARQYAANNKDFSRSLLRDLHDIRIPNLLNTTEMLLERLPKEIYDQLYERALDDLEIFDSEGRNSEIDTQE